MEKIFNKKQIYIKVGLIAFIVLASNLFLFNSALAFTCSNGKTNPTVTVYHILNPIPISQSPQDNGQTRVFTSGSTPSFLVPSQVQAYLTGPNGGGNYTDNYITVGIAGGQSGVVYNSNTHGLEQIQPVATPIDISSLLQPLAGNQSSVTVSLVDTGIVYGTTGYDLNLLDCTQAPTLNVSCASKPGSIQVGESTVFTANISGGAGNNTFSWSGACTGSGQNCINVINYPGNQQATVVVTSGTQTKSATCSVSVAQPVTIPTLNVTCSPNPSSVRQGGSSTISAIVSGGTGNYSYSWSGACTGSNSSCLAVFPNAGTQSATVAVTSGTQTKSASCSVDVTPSLTATCSANPSSIQTGNSSTFTSNVSGGTGNYSYSWSGACTGSSSTCSKNYSSTGTQSESLTVTSGNQNASASCSLNVTQSVPQYCANGSTMTYAEVKTAQSAGKLTYSWNGSTVQIHNTTGCTAPLDVASYKVYVAPKNPGWLSTQVYIGESGVTNISANGTTTLSAPTVSCETQADLYYGLAPHQLFDADQNNPDIAKTLSYNLIVGTLCQNTPDLTVSCTANPSSIQTGNSSTFTSNVSGGTGNYAYTWSGTCTGSNQNCTKTFNTAGSYSSTVTVVSGSQTKTASCSVNVAQTIPNLTATCSANPSSIQTGQSSTFISNVSGGTGSYIYSWSGACTGSSSNCVNTFSNPGTQSSALIVVSGSQTASAACSVNVTQAPPQYCANGSTMTLAEVRTAMSQGKLTYSWSNSSSQATITVHNSTGCSAPFDLATYKVFVAPRNPGWLSTQIFIGESGVTNIVGNGSTTLSSPLASCETQADLYYGSAPHQLFDSNESSINNITLAYEVVGSTLCQNTQELTVSCVANPNSITTGQSSTFTPTVSGGTGSYSYNWSGACTSSSVNCSKVYNTAGTQQETVVVTSGSQTKTANCSLVVTQNTPDLTVSCTANPSSIQTGNSSTFTSNVSGGTGSYSYTWSGTCTGSNQNCTKTFNTAGSYSSTVTVVSGSQQKSANCSVDVSQNIPDLTVSCSANPSSIPVGNSSTFTPNISGGNGSYSYNWSGACTSSSVNCSKVYNTAGTQQETVVVTSGSQTKTANCSLEVTQNIPDLTVSCSANPNSIPVGNSSTFTPTVSGGTGSYAYAWSGSCTGSAFSCTKVYNTAGTQQETVVVTSGSQTKTANCSVEITQNIQSLSVSCNANPSSIPVGNSSTFTPTVSGGTGSYSYIWAGACTSNSQNCTKTYNTAGTQQETVIVVSGSQQGTANCSLEVTQNIQTLTATCSANPSSIPTGNSSTFTPVVSGGTGVYSYSWAGACTSNSQNCTKTYNTAGTQQETVIVTSGYQQTTANCSVEVTQNTPDLTVSCVANPSSIQAGNSSTFTSTVAGGTGNYTYSWSGACSGSSANCTQNFPNAGNQSSTIIVTSGSQTKTATCSVNVTQTIQDLSVSCDANPSSIQTGDSTTFESNVSGGTGNYTYSWSGACTGSNQDCTKTFTSTGSHSSSVTVTSGSQHRSASCSVSVSQTTPDLSVTCSANPSSITTGQSSTFISNVSGGSGNYTYSWAGVCTGSSANCTQTYNTAGSQSDTLVVTSGSQTKTATCSVNVTQTTSNLTVSCYATPNPTNSNQTVSFISNISGGSGGYTYSWSGACTGNSQVCSGYITGTGSQAASITVTSGSQSSSASCYVSVNQNCTLNSQERCSGNSLYWYDSCGNQGSLVQYCSNGCSGSSCIINNCTYHSYERCSGNNLYWYDSCGNMQDLVQYCPNGCSNNSCTNNITNAYLTLTKTIRDLTTGTSFSNSTYANPSDTLMYLITLQANGNQNVQNVLVRDILPTNITYADQLIVACTGTNNNSNNCNSNNYNYSGSILNGINLNTIYPGQTVTISYEAQVAPVQNFAYGTTTLNNSATATSSNAGYVPTAIASAIVTRASVLGASTISTGLTNNFWVDSFFLPLLITLIGIWMWRSGMFFGIEKWLENKKKARRAYKAQKELLTRIESIRKSGV